MNFGNSKKSNRICIIIALFVMITGMCFDKFETDSMFLCVGKEKIQERILSIGSSMWEQQICIPELLQAKNISRVETSWGRNENQGRREVVIGFLTEEFMLKELVSILLFYGIVISLSIIIRERITNFVHKSDGKKRVCIG